MTRSTTTLSLSIALVFACCAPIAHAAEPRQLTKTQSSQKTSVSQVDSKLKTTGQLFIDPHTGQVSKTKPSSGSGGTKPATDETETSHEPPELLPYDFFIADDGSSVLNSYFLSQLSMGVYCNGLTELDFTLDLMEKFGPQGIGTYQIDVKMDHDSGTELAVFTIGNATVITFRGTSSLGTTNPDKDVEVDLLDVPIKVKVNDKECRVHQGFWESTDAVYDWVFEHALNAHSEGQKIYLTGHSLGAARATVAAFRLHYEDDIPVHSLQTFGSPKVGDLDFKLMCSDYGADDIKLAEVTERFVVLGDPATTFPHKEVIGVNWKGPIVVYYEHVGNTHNINPLNGTNSSSYDIAFDSGEIFFIPTGSQWYGFLNGVGNNEHMLYDDALLAEVINDPQYIEIKDLLIEHEAVVQTAIGE